MLTTITSAKKYADSADSVRARGVQHVWSFKLSTLFVSTGALQVVCCPDMSVSLLLRLLRLANGGSDPLEASEQRNNASCYRRECERTSETRRSLRDEPANYRSRVCGTTPSCHQSFRLEGGRGKSRHVEEQISSSMPSCHYHNGWGGDSGK